MRISVQGSVKTVHLRCCCMYLDERTSVALCSADDQRMTNFGQTYLPYINFWRLAPPTMCTCSLASSVISASSALEIRERRAFADTLRGNASLISSGLSVKMNRTFRIDNGIVFYGSLRVQRSNPGWFMLSMSGEMGDIRWVVQRCWSY